MDKITVVCHKDHVVGYEDYRGQCLLCVVEDLMREVGRLTAVCKEKEWVGLTANEVLELLPSSKWKAEETFLFVQRIQDELKEKNS